MGLTDRRNRIVEVLPVRIERRTDRVTVTVNYFRALEAIFLLAGLSQQHQHTTLLTRYRRASSDGVEENNASYHTISGDRTEGCNAERPLPRPASTVFVATVVVAAGIRVTELHHISIARGLSVFWCCEFRTQLGMNEHLRRCVRPATIRGEWVSRNESELLY